MHLSSAPLLAPLCAAVIPLLCSSLPPQGPSWTLLANSQAHVGPPAPSKPSTPTPQPLSLRYPLPLALLPGMLEGQWRGEANQQRPPLPPFLSSCQTPDKAFSPSFPALNGLILSGNLSPSQTSSQAGVSSDLRSSPIPLPPAGSAPSEQPNGTDHGLQSWFLSGMQRGWACLGRGLRGLVPVVSYQDFLEDPPLAPL